MAPAASSPADAPPKDLHEGAPLERRVFESWSAFDEYIEAYARSSFQLFRKRTSTSVKLRNRRVAERCAKTAAESAAARLIPETYGNYSLTLVCTHSGAFVSRGTGRRARQDVRATHCNVQVNACLKLADPATNRYEVTVTRALLTHNHRVDRETFLQYSNTRLNLSEELLSCVELMRKTGVKPKEVRSYIMEHSSCVPTHKDVQNIMQRLRSQEEAAAVAAANTDLEQTQVTVVSDEHEVAKLSSDDQALQDYRLASSASTSEEKLDPVDPSTQFQVSRAVGKAVATLLAEMPAAQFPGAFRVLEVAMNIVRERQEEKQTRLKAPASDSEATTGVESGVNGASAAPAVNPWARSL
jgi:hypothetical protein